EGREYAPAEQTLVSRLFIFLTTLSRPAASHERLALVASGMVTVVPSAMGGVALVDEAGEWTISWRAKGAPLEVPQGLSRQLEPLRRLASGRQTLLLASREEGTDSVAVPQLLEARRIGRLAVVALRTTEGMELGIVFAGREGGRPFTSIEQLALQALAQHVATTLDNARLRASSPGTVDQAGQRPNTPLIEPREPARAVDIAYSTAPGNLPASRQDELLTENTYLRQVSGEGEEIILGHSTAIVHLREVIRTAARADANILITGETGTPGEPVARSVHILSNQSERLLIVVDCRQTDLNILSYNLFNAGSETVLGRFQLARGSTLFLNEVARLPLSVQDTLIRRLDDEPIPPPDGSPRVRLIASTTIELSREVEAGRFREDLFYRLNVFPIQVAPLRRRRDDIPELAAHYMDRASMAHGGLGRQLTDTQLRRLREADWPGNDRELQCVLERAVLRSCDDRLSLDFLMSEGDLTSAPELPADDRVRSEHEMRRAQRDNLRRALGRTRWKIYGPDGAAALLGIKPTTLVARIKKSGLRRPRSVWHTA
ncbi:MAG: sigma 54-interacting transcriptional regulator, partial [Acidobacteriota bacterium]|nr:sigma 54-interacting transcriptional regulator [Acidobacteriota bacterium]